MLRIVALLYAGATGPDGLRAFEGRTLPLLRSHGGRLLLAIAPEDAGDGPDEIHVLEFPSRDAFDAYRADPRVLALADERAAAISRSEVYTAHAPISYD